MNYDEMFAYVAEHKSTIESTLPYLETKHGKLVALNKDELADRILAVDLMLTGIRDRERVQSGVKTEDQTHCNCGMEICLDDLGRNGDELLAKSKALLHAWAEYQAKIDILQKNYDEDPEGKSSPDELVL